MPRMGDLAATDVYSAFDVPLEQSTNVGWANRMGEILTARPPDNPAVAYKTPYFDITEGDIGRATEAAMGVSGGGMTVKGSPKLISVEGKPLTFYKAMEGDIPNMQAETGLTHVAMDRATAEQFSKGGKRPVREVNVAAENPFDYRNQEHLKWLLSQMDDPKNVAAYNRDTQKIMGPDYEHIADAKYIKAGLEEGAYQAYEVPAIRDLIRSRGHDAMYMIEDFQKGNPNLAVFDPSQIVLLDVLKKYGLAGAVATPVMGALAAQDTYRE